MRMASDKIDVMGRPGRPVLDMRMRRQRPSVQAVGEPYHLQCTVASTSTVTIRGGTLYQFAADVLTKVNLASAGAEYTATATLNVQAGTNTQYVIITKDDALVPTTWTASMTTSAPSAADRTVMQVAHVAVTDGAISGPLYQDWNGGNVMEFFMDPDGESLEYYTNGELQIHGFATAADSTSDELSLFPYKHYANGDIEWCYPQTIVEAVDDWSGVDFGATPPKLNWKDLADTDGDPLNDAEFSIPMTYNDGGGQYLVLLDPSSWSLPTLNVTTSIKVDGTKVVGSQVVDADLGNTPNTGDTDTDDMIQALADLVIAHGLGATA